MALLNLGRAKVTFCVQGVISPLLANLFLHYAFDAWMSRNYRHIPFERYADDAICHRKSAEEARALWSALQVRFAACKLVLHPEKTKIVYCKDANRGGDFPNQSFDFLRFTFRARKALGRGRRAFACFLPAASPKALTSISRTVRRWALHHRSDKSLQDLAAMYNPCIRGWINYYSHFYKTQLRPTLKRIDLYVIRWARRKFKRLRRKTKGARDWFDRLRRVIQRSSPIGSSAMETAEHREPYEPRGSRTDLGAPGGKSSGRLDRTSKAQNELTFSGLLPTAELRLGARGYVGACLIEVSYERYFTFPIGTRIMRYEPKSSV